MFTANAVTYSNLTVQNQDSFLTYSTNRGITLAGGTVWFRVGWSKQTVIEAPVTGPGRLGVPCDGAYMLLANQANDCTGGTWIGGGGGWWDSAGSAARLRLGNNEVIPHGPGKGDVLVSNVVNAVANKWTGWLEMNGFSETINGLWGNGTVSNNVATPVTLTLGAADASGVFTGTIDDGPNGAISIVKVGRGQQSLAGTNRFDGSITVQNGLLGVGGVGQVGGDLNLHAFASLSAGMTNLPQTLTVLGTTRATNATVVINLSGVNTPGGGINDLLALQGLQIEGANRFVVLPTAPLATGVPCGVVTYTSVGGAGTIAAEAPGTRYTIAVDTLTPGQVNLIASGALSNLVWSGLNRRWNVTNSASWSAAATETVGNLVLLGGPSTILMENGTGAASLTLESGATFAVELNGLAAGTGYDQLLMSGGTLTLDSPDLFVTLGFAPSLGNSFTIIDGLTSFDPGTHGTFDGKPDGHQFLVGSTLLQIDDSSDSITLTVVPEPATMSLVGLSLIAVVLRRRLRV